MKYALSLATAALLLGGCASSYNKTLMPRDSGKLYSGVIEDSGRGEGRVAVTIEDKTYEGTWVQVTSERSTGFVTARPKEREHMMLLAFAVTCSSPIQGIPRSSSAVRGAVW